MDLNKWVLLFIWVHQIISLNIFDDTIVPAVEIPVPWYTQPFPLNHIRDNIQSTFISTCSKTKIRDGRCLCPSRYHNTHLVYEASQDSFVVVAVDEVMKQVIVSYRPTLSVFNAVTDFNFPLIPLPGAPRGVKVHLGFYNYFIATHNRTKVIVHNILKNSQYNDYTLHATGYSLGGAIATLSTSFWLKFLDHYSFPNPFQVYSYAGPRVGNLKFVNYLAQFQIPLVRYTNRYDTVSHTPPRIFGYHHAGLEFYLTRPNPNLKKYLKTCSAYVDEDPNCSVSDFPLSNTLHLLPFGQVIPSPPYC